MLGDLKTAQTGISYGTRALDMIMGMVSSGADLAMSERQQRQALQQNTASYNMQLQLLNEQLVQQDASSQQAAYIEEQIGILQRRGSPFDETTFRAITASQPIPQWVWVTGGIIVTAAVTGVVIWLVVR